MTLEWGNVPDWLSLGAAAAAALGALLLLRKQGQEINLQAEQLRHEVERARASDEARTYEQRLSQARNVHYRMATRGGSAGDGVMESPVEIEVSNNSGGVLNHVSVRVWCVSDPQPIGAAEHQKDLGRMLPNETEVAKILFKFDVSGMPTMFPPTEYLSEVTFDDAAGVRWRIDNEHRLAEV